MTFRPVRLAIALCGLGASFASLSAASAEEIVAKCPFSVIARTTPAGEEPAVYTPLFRPGALEFFADGGCGQIQKGCNSCTVRYANCAPRARALCRDARCLATFCEREIVCTAKRCAAVGAAPSCASRLTQMRCVRPLDMRRTDGRDPAAQRSRRPAPLWSHAPNWAP